MNLKSYSGGSFLFFLLIIFFGFFPSISEANVLDNKTFIGELGEKGKKQGDKDTFIFTNGMFESKACTVYGFDKSPYDASKSRETVIFSSETKSEQEGRMKWMGKVIGDKIEGTAIWYKQGQNPVEYWFNGSLEK